VFGLVLRLAQEKLKNSQGKTQASSPQEVFTNKNKEFLMRARPLCRNQQEKYLHGAAYQASHVQCFKADG